MIRTKFLNKESYIVRPLCKIKDFYNMVRRHHGEYHKNYYHISEKPYANLPYAILTKEQYFLFKLSGLPHQLKYFDELSLDRIHHMNHILNDEY